VPLLPPPQNGAYAWRAIVPSVFCVAFSVMGLQYCAGLLLQNIINKFGVIENGVIVNQAICSGVLAVAIGVLMIAMGPAGKVQVRIGQTKTVAIGGVLVAIGVLITAFATELWHVYVGYSIIASFGLGMAYLGAVTSCALWFTPDKRPFAVAIATGGSGFGTIILGHVTLALQTSSSDPWMATWLTLGAVSTVGIIVSSLFFRPPTITNAEPSNMSTREVLKTPDYGYFLSVLVVFGLGAWTPIVLFPVLAESHAVSGAAGAIEIGFGIGAVLGRPVAAHILTLTGRRQGFPGIILLMALTAFLAPVMSTSWAGCFINNAMYGWGFGAFISTIPPITAEIVGGAKMEQAIGLTYASPGITFMIGSPLCGALFPNTSGAYYFSGACLTLSGLMMMKLSRAAMVAAASA